MTILRKSIMFLIIKEPMKIYKCFILGEDTNLLCTIFFNASKMMVFLFRVVLCRYINSKKINI